MTELAAPSLRQINLVNPALLPTREIFSARLIVAGVVVSALAMAAIAWWAIIETRSITREVSNQAAQQAAEKGRAAGGEALPTPQQVAAREQTLRNQQALLETRRAVRDVLRRGLAGDQAGPSALMRLIASTLPPQAWVTEVRVAGSHFDVTGKTLDPAAVNVWLDRLRESGFLAAKPVAAIRIEQAVPAPTSASVPTPVALPAPSPARALPAYTFSISAALSSPFADDGGRQ